jgi:hypothetical protein
MRRKKKKRRRRKREKTKYNHHQIGNPDYITCKKKCVFDFNMYCTKVM